jgi:polysaccharide chain length determinant protein (PEP-CTERM system associated)
MDQTGFGQATRRPKPQTHSADATQWSAEHYLRLILHRKWLVLATFVVVSIGTAVFSYRLPDSYRSETVILVDPQKVPETYIKSTVTGDIRGRLSTLSQQILSATRLQKIIENLNLYPQERKMMAREDVLAEMRGDIGVTVLSDFGGGQDLQAFRITYSGKEPRLVAQVTNELASLFIEENLKAREQQATGTTEFLQNQLQETRKLLDDQEAKLKDFKLHHIGEMPEHEAADLQILGQLQSQLQIESEALSRAEQQKSYLQSMMAAGSAPVVDLDDAQTKPASSAAAPVQPTRNSTLMGLRASLAKVQSRYSDIHPEVQRLKRLIAEEERKQKEATPKETAEVAADGLPEAVQTEAIQTPTRPANVATPARHVNPVLQSQLQGVEAEIAKRKEEQRRLSKAIASEQAKLEAIPVREQQVTGLVRDYEIAKAHYKGLLEKQLSAETATQLEIRQKGERFSVLDPAQPAQRPYKPNRQLINAAGCIVGLGLGLMLAVATELLGISITTAEQVVAVSGFPVLEMVPMIETRVGREVRRKRLILSGVCGGVLILAGMAAVLLYRYGPLVF